MKTRRHLWELGCSPMDAVLWTSFDWEDLVNLDSSIADARRKHAEHASANPAPDHIVFAVAHRFCHEGGPVAQKIEKFLNIMHRRTVDSLAALPSAQVLDYLAQTPYEELEDLGGVLWAIFSDPREELRGYDLSFAQGLALRAVKAWLSRQPEKTGPLPAEE